MQKLIPLVVLIVSLQATHAQQWPKPERVTPPQWAKALTSALKQGQPLAIDSLFPTEELLQEIVTAGDSCLESDPERHEKHPFYGHMMVFGTSDMDTLTHLYRTQIISGAYQALNQSIVEIIQAGIRPHDIHLDSTRRSAAPEMMPNADSCPIRGRVKVYDYQLHFSSREKNFKMRIEIMEIDHAQYVMIMQPASIPMDLCHCAQRIKELHQLTNHGQTISTDPKYAEMIKEVELDCKDFPVSSEEELDEILNDCNKQ